MDSLKKKLIPLLNKLPYIKPLRKLLNDYEQQTAYPPGHYYSPIPDISEIEENREKIFNKADPMGIDLNEKKSGSHLEIDASLF